MLKDPRGRRRRGARRATTIGAAVGAVAALSLAGLTLPANAADGTWYVDQANGSDAAACGVEAGPAACATIGAALAQVAAGDVVEIAAGVYAEALVLTTPVTLQGSGGVVLSPPLGDQPTISVEADAVLIADMTIHATEAIEDGVPLHPAVLIEEEGEDRGATLSGVNVTVAPDSIGGIAGAVAIGGATLDIENSTFTGLAYGIQGGSATSIGAPGPNITITSTTVTGGLVGVQLISGDATIIGGEISGAAFAGIAGQGPEVDIDVTGTEISGNGQGENRDTYSSGVLLRQGGTFSGENVTISGNASGVLMENGGVVNLLDSVVTDNLRDGQGIGIGGPRYDAEGGAPRPQITITTTEISGHTTGVSLAATDAVVTDSDIHENTVGLIAGEASDVTISGGSISDNAATGVFAADEPSADAPVIIDLNNTTIARNGLEADWEGGAAFGFGGIATRFSPQVTGVGLQITGNAVGASVQGGGLTLFQSNVSDSVVLPADNPLSAFSGFGILASLAGDDWVADVTLVNTTVSGNASAGIWATPESRGAIVHSTIAENGGVGIAFGGGEGDPDSEAGEYVIAGSTIAQNAGGALQLDGDLVTIGSIVQAPDGVPACSGELAGLTDSGFNVASDNSCALDAATSLVADPELAPLADNGGPTLTMMPGVASPALNVVPPGTTYSGDGFSVDMCADDYDQRGVGFHRLVGPACDAGSVELGSAVITVTASDATTYVGADEPEITPSLSGFLPGDSQADLDTLPTCGYDIDAGTTMCSGAADDFYSFEYVNGTLTVLDPLVFVTESLPDATVGEEYSVTLEASGGDGGPYTWGIAEGSSLPAGLDLNTETGVISGVPEVAGEATFTLFVGDPIYQELTLTVAPAAPTEPTDPPTSDEPTTPPATDEPTSPPATADPTDQPTDAAPAPTGGDAGPGQGLPDTGTSGLTTLAIGAAMLMLGLAVMLIVRRHRHQGAGR